MKTAFSGINPSSSKGLHLGNFLGAVKPQVEFQSEAKCIYFVANMHTLNTVFDPKEVEKNTMGVFLDYLAFGVDPEKTVFFVQSDVPSIPYLQSILNNAVTVSELMRMHAYKDKLQNDEGHESISMGLFSYPVLMAADILAFKPDIVPVGEDQTQHVEITREIARTFNNRYGNILKIPELHITKQGARVKGIDGERKMSKSLGNDISIFAPEKEIRKQIMRITTDPNRKHADDPGDPDKNVTFEYLELLEFDAGKIEAMKERYRAGTIGDVEIKETFADHFMEYFKGYREKRKELEGNMEYVYEVRTKGAQAANRIAEDVLSKVKTAIGLTTKVSKSSEKPIIEFDDFMKLDLRIGTIVEAEQHPNADKLLRLLVDFGEHKRQILAGIAEMKIPEDLIGKQIPVVFNLAPREMRGLESQGMIMAVDNGSGIALLHPETKVENGALVR